ncbi:MAG: leucine-rich repeat domain-containing protein, partial [Synergistaceae bacterium]|nr:leucine-rich repeat domain-containing protein [Synergistaceae bacterium]
MCFTDARHSARKTILIWQTGMRRLKSLSQFIVFFLILIFSALISPGCLFALTIDVATLNGGPTITLTPNEVIEVTGTDQINTKGWNTLKALTGNNFSLVFNNGQLTIPNKAMLNNSFLTSFTANNVTAIGEYAFYGCTSLAQTSLPAGVTSIGNNAFSMCTNLALTSLPPGLTSISYSAFSFCPSLALTSLPSGLTSIGGNAFRACTSLALTSLPSGLTSIGGNAFYYCTSLALTSLPSGLTSFGEYVFIYCAGLEWLDLSSCVGLTSIGYGAFKHCESLATVAMPPVRPTEGGNIDTF